jgi:hypothetical protein
MDEIDELSANMASQPEALTNLECTSHSDKCSANCIILQYTVVCTLVDGTELKLNFGQAGRLAISLVQGYMVHSMYIHGIYRQYLSDYDHDISGIYHENIKRI